MMSRWAGFGFRVLLLLSLSAAAAAVFNQVRSSGRLAWVGDWDRYIETRASKAGIRLADLSKAREWVEGGQALILDARPAADYEAGHLPGAFNVPSDEMDTRLADVQSRLTRQGPILAYCSGVECDESFLLSRFLKDQQFTNVLLFAGGYKEWTAAGLAVQTGAKP